MSCMANFGETLNRVTVLRGRALSMSSFITPAVVMAVLLLAFGAHAGTHERDEEALKWLLNSINEAIGMGRHRSSTDKPPPSISKKQSYTEIHCSVLSEFPVVSKSCGVIASGNELHAPNLTQVFFVRTLIGCTKMRAKDLLDMRFFGPVHLSGLECDQILELPSPCTNEDWRRSLHFDCPGRVVWVSLCVLSGLISLLGFMLSVLSVGIFRFKRMLNLSSSRAQFISSKKGLSCKYVKVYNQDGTSESKHPREEKGTIYEEKSHEFSWKSLILLGLFLSPRPVSAYVVEINRSTMNKNFHYKIVISEDEVVSTAVGPLSIEDSYFRAPLLEMFKTSDWKLIMREDYRCQWYNCRVMMQCGYTSVGLEPANPSIIDYLKMNQSNLLLATCFLKKRYCMFGDGCKIVGVEVAEVEGSKAKVYSILKGGEDPVKVIHPKECDINKIEDRRIGSISDYIAVRDIKGNWLLCEKDLYSLEPTPSFLGDYRILNSGKREFFSRHILCTDSDDGPCFCGTYKSFISDLNTLCKPLRDFRVGPTVIKNGSIIRWKKRGEVEVDLDCTIDLELKDAKSSCIEVKITTWSAPHMGESIIMTFIGTSATGKSTYSFSSGVKLSTHTFLCDGKPHIAAVYDLDSLTKSGVEVESHSYSLEDLSVDLIHHSSDIGPNHAGNWFGSFSLSSLLPMGLSSSFMIAAGLCLLVIIKL